MDSLHDWVVQWCTDNLPGWLGWTVSQVPIGGETIELVLGSGGMRRGLTIVVKATEQDGLGPRLAQETQSYITEIRDRCDAWLLRQAVRSTMPVAASPECPHREYVPHMASGGASLVWRCKNCGHVLGNGAAPKPDPYG